MNTERKKKQPNFLVFFFAHRNISFHKFSITIITHFQSYFLVATSPRICFSIRMTTRDQREHHKCFCGIVFVAVSTQFSCCFFSYICSPRLSLCFSECVSLFWKIFFLVLNVIQIKALSIEKKVYSLFHARLRWIGLVFKGFISFFSKYSYRLKFCPYSHIDCW